MTTPSTTDQCRAVTDVAVGRSPGPAPFAFPAFILSAFDSVRRSDVLFAPVTFTPVALPSFVPVGALVSGLCPVIRHAPSMRATDPEMPIARSEEPRAGGGLRPRAPK